MHEVTRVDMEHPGMVSLAAHSRVVREMGKERDRMRISRDLYRVVAAVALLFAISYILLDCAGAS